MVIKVRPFVYQTATSALLVNLMCYRKQSTMLNKESRHINEIPWMYKEKALTDMDKSKRIG